MLELRGRDAEPEQRGGLVGQPADEALLENGRELALEHGYAHSIVATPWDRSDVAAARTLDAHELAGGRGRGMNGTHRKDGVWIAAGGDASWRRAAPASIEAVAARVLAALGLADEAGVDPGGPDRAPLPYSAEEEARVAARLRALGYLE